jgi:D-arginine dehydrogenase
MKARGGRIITDAEVEAIEHGAGRWSVATRAGPFEALHLVNAAGAWADEIARKAGLRPLGLQPKRRTAFTIDPPPSAAIDAWPLVNDIGEEFYFKPDAGQIMVSPADAEPSPPTDAQAEELDVAIGVDRLQQATSIVVTRVNRKWAGLRTFARDGNPIVGEDPAARGFFWLAGQGGYGIKTAPALSRILAGLVRAGSLPAAAAAAGVSAEELSPRRFAAAILSPD